MPLAYPRALGPGVRRVVGDDELIEIGDDDGVALLRPENAGRHVLVLHQRPPDPCAVLAEADRLSWLDGRTAAPEVLAAGRADEGDEAVVIRMAAEATTATRGHPLGPERLIAVLATTLRAVHGIDIAQCPLVTDQSVLRAELDDRVARGSVTAVDGGPYGGRSVAELVALVDSLFDGLDDDPRGEPVMIHGGLRPDRVWFDTSGDVTLTGWRRGGAGDRHLDLAAAAMMVHDLHGPALVPALLDAYGLDDVDPRRLDAHQLLVHLLR